MKVRFCNPSINYYLLILVIVIILSSCRQNRLICEYIARNKVIQHTAGTVDSINISELLHRYDRRNRCYFEMATYTYKGQTRLIIATDMFNDLVRYNVFMGFSRGFSIYDKYANVSYIELDSVQIKQFIQSYKNFPKPAYPMHNSIPKDYAIAKDVFITLFHGNFLFKNETTLKPTLWLQGRKIRLPRYNFIQKLERISWK